MTGPFYPSLVATFTAKENKIDVYDADDINYPQNEINAIETEIGTNVKGSAADLKTRLGVITGTDGALRKGTSFPGSPIEGQAFYKTDEDTLYIYDGSDWDAVTTAASQTLFSFGLSTGYLASSYGVILGTGYNESISSLRAAYWAVVGTTFQTVIHSKFKKLVGVNTMKVYAWIWQYHPSEGRKGCVQIDIGSGTLTGSTAGSADQVTPEQVTFTMDLSGLDVGTYYDMDIKLRNNSSTVQYGAMGSIIGFGY